MVAGGSETGEAAMGKGGVMAAGDGGLAGWSLQTAIFSNRHRQMDAVWFATTACTEVLADSHAPSQNCGASSLTSGRCFLRLGCSSRRLLRFCKRCKLQSLTTQRRQKTAFLAGQNGQFIGVSNKLEHFHQIYSAAPLVPRNSGLFGFWLCFSSVTGFSNLRLR